MAKSLFGMAHVVVEPSRAFSRELMKAVDGKNVYGGAIALYWPEGGRRCFFVQKGAAQAEDIKHLIFEEIRQSLIHRRPLVRCTLAAVKELKSRRQINALKDAGSKAVEEYVAAFEEEKKSKSDALEAAEAEIKRLKGELRHARAKIRERIKGALRGCQSMDARTRRELEQLGFSISDDGKHLKLVYQGDDRYTFPLPKSGSDHRGGLNAAGDLCRILLA